MDEKKVSDEIESYQNLKGVIDHTRAYDGINVLSTEEEADVTSIQSINGTN